MNFLEVEFDQIRRLMKFPEDPFNKHMSFVNFPVTTQFKSSMDEDGSTRDLLKRLQHITIIKKIVIISPF